MGKDSSYYILTLPLQTQRWQEDILEKRYAVAENIYNAMLRKAYTRYTQMCQSNQYRTLRRSLSETSDAKERKEIYRSLDQLARKYSLGKFELSRDATPYRQYFKENIDSPVSQNLAANVWKAIYTVMKGKGRKVTYKKPGELLALSGKTNNTSIRYKDGVVIWKGLEMPVRFHKNSQYERDTMKNTVRLCHLKRQKIKNRWHYYVDLVFAGVSPVKKSDIISKPGKIGLDVRSGQIALATNDEVKVVELPVSYVHYQNEINKLKAYMHRSAYKTNPNNFDQNGKVRFGNLKWRHSKRYEIARQRRKELFRKLTAIRKQDYCVLARQIIQMGDQLVTREFSWNDMRKTPRPAEKKKERYFFSGKPPSAAPGTFLQILTYKMKNAGGQVYQISSEHLESLGVANVNAKNNNLWQSVQGYSVLKNVYTAFLLTHIDQFTNTINLSECQNCFPTFIQLCKNYQSNLDEKLHILKIGETA